MKHNQQIYVFIILIALALCLLFLHNMECVPELPARTEVIKAGRMANVPLDTLHCKLVLQWGAIKGQQAKQRGPEIVQDAEFVYSGGWLPKEIKIIITQNGTAIDSLKYEPKQ